MTTGSDAWTAAVTAEWARLLIHSLVEAGIEHAVISPGSRSTPLTWAALQHPELECVSVLDERVAGFLAVGRAKLTGSPSLLICTSGSAAANYFPALVEAAQSATPVVVLTADRPFELQHRRAPQTMDQVKLYGDHCRSFWELGMPDAHPEALIGLQRTAAQAVFSALHPLPGPVHLNARARKPLAPPVEQTPEHQELRANVDRLIQAGTPRLSALGPSPRQGELGPVLQRLELSERGLIVCGTLPCETNRDATARARLASNPPTSHPSTASEVLRLAEVTGLPLVCEPASQVRFAASLSSHAPIIDGIEWLSRAGFARVSSDAGALDGSTSLHEPNWILQLGGPLVGSGWEALSTRWRHVPRCTLAPLPVGAPDNRVDSLFVAPIADSLCWLVEQLSRITLPDARRAARRRWAESWQRANERAWHCVESSLNDSEFSEPLAVRTIVDALPDGSLLALGNSLPIRQADLYCRAGARGLSVWCQRGVNGIDGLVSGAVGAASVSARPVTLVIGELSLLHDVGGLCVADRAKASFVIVVLDNGGGRIFEQLPAGAAQGTDEFARFWLTPQRAEIAHAAALYDLSYTEARDVDSLQRALTEAHDGSRPSIVHVRVPPHSAAHQQRRIVEALERDLASQKVQPSGDAP